MDGLHGSTNLTPTNPVILACILSYDADEDGDPVPESCLDPDVICCREGDEICDGCNHFRHTDDPLQFTADHNRGFHGTVHTAII